MNIFVKNTHRSFDYDCVFRLDLQKNNSHFNLTYYLDRALAL